MTSHQIYWSGPTLIIVPFVLGICSAVCHHVLHTSFNAQYVVNDTMQQWLLRISTGLAFITNFFFTLSASTSYVQWFWYQLRGSRLRLNEANALFGILQDLSRFFRSTVWWRTPAITMLALIAWLLPLAVVFPPGTITVRQASHTSFEPVTVMQSNFEKATLAGRIVGEDADSYEILTTPASEQLYASALSSGRILTVPHEKPSANVSYQLTFYGPALKCAAVEDENVRRFVNNAVEELETTRNTSVSLLSFFPDKTFGPDMNSSAFAVALNEEITIKQLEAYADFISSDVSRFYIRNSLGNDSLENRQPKNGPHFLRAMNQTEHSTCGFYNASYTVYFNLYSSGAQFLKVETDIKNPIALKDYFDLLLTSTPGSPEAYTIRSYLSLIYMFGSDVTGAILFTQAGGSEPTVTYPLQSKTLQKQVSSPGNIYTTFLQEAFRNVTVSTRYGLTGPNFNIDGRDFAERYGSKLSNVTANAMVTILQNDFHYKPRALIISYSLSAFGCAVCLGFGLFAIWRNQGCFSNDFSTLFRVARAQLDGLRWDEGERVGYDPLPKGIGRTTIRSMVLEERKEEEIGELVSCTSNSSDKKDPTVLELEQVNEVPYPKSQSTSSFPSQK